jgi:hypothetical protein
MPNNNSISKFISGFDSQPNVGSPRFYHPTEVRRLQYDKRFKDESGPINGQRGNVADSGRDLWLYEGPKPLLKIIVSKMRGIYMFAINDFRETAWVYVEQMNTQ